MKLTSTPAHRLMAVAAAVVALALSAATNAQTYMGKAEVRSVNGQAFYSTGPGAPMMPLKSGTVLGPGATVKTQKGGAVELFLGRSTGTVRLAEDTTLTLDKFTISDTGA